MSIKTRRVLFYSFVILFVVLGTLIVLLSRGVRFDFDSFSVVETGGAYVSSQPISTKITFDDEDIKNKAGIFQKGTLISGVAPGEHSLNIQADGYSSWSKTFEVESSEVAVFDSIILVPDQKPELETEVAAKNFISRNSHMAFESGGGVVLNDEGVFGHQIIEFTEDNFLLSKSTETGNYYLAQATADPEGSINVSRVFNSAKIQQLGLPGNVQIKDIQPYPNNGSRFVIATEGALYTLDAQRSSIEQIALGVNEFTLQSSDVVWIDDEGINTFSLLFGNHSVALPADEIPTNTKLAYLIDGKWFVLTLNQELVLLGDEDITVATGVSKILTDEGDNKLLFTLRNALHLYAVEDEENIQLKSFNSNIDQVEWFNGGSHVLVLAGEVLTFIEVDTRPPINNIDLASGVKAFSYDPGEDFVLFLNDSGVWRKDIRL